MNKIMLINRVDPENNKDEKKKIFFSIGEMNISKVEDKILDILHREGFVQKDNFVLKYNGIELKITIQEIPKIIKLLSKENIDIYSVFELYNPDL